MNKVDFISAKNGGIEVSYNARNCTGPRCSAWALTAANLAALLVKHGLDDSCFHSSSMDFASEDGFKDDGDAWVMWDEAGGIYNWEVNGVAS